MPHPHDRMPRPAREIAIEVRKRATHDSANYDPGLSAPPDCETTAAPAGDPRRSFVAWWRYLLGLDT